jgi:putative phosphoesterase
VILGVISDTHGLLRPEAVAALQGVDRIIHAGDVGGPEVLAALAAIAPVVAVRGNNDRGPWAEALPLTQIVEREGRSSTSFTTSPSWTWIRAPPASAPSSRAIPIGPDSISATASSG